ncbi:beta strand repeat-containing protein [Anabaena sp. UHCC 0451]|uniref:beta strand repeat-containing protein n=1 Tax=Anabaena sp. UHCC 0451 TaxID=2055235 RepID=UPI002B1EF565|nr:SBBP repeat-containing protein [Anabaena sp. UHCC 0451]MEA5579085.1 SBBP repeat-containing protein [Anabaena sp. UHCC 0451]
MATIKPIIDIFDVSIIEGNSGTKQLVFSVTLNQATTETISIRYTTQDGTATTANNDYTAVTGTLNFAPGETFKTFAITIRGDAQVEANETFKVNLNLLSGQAIFNKTQGIGTIVNDDKSYFGYKSFVQFGTSDNDNARGISADSSGNVYVTGYTYGSLPGNTNQGDFDAFVVKYNNDGTQAWVKQFGTAGYDEANGISADSSGNIYVSGNTFRSLADNAYIAKYNTNGTQAWIKQFGSNNSEASSISTDSSGNIYVVGQTSGTLPSNTNQGGDDAFIAKYNTDGTQAWIKQFGTSSYEETSGISTDRSGNICVVGNTSGSLPGNTNQGNSDTFIAKYNSDGTQAWVKQFGSNSIDEARDISTDNNANIYVTGWTNGSLAGYSNQGYYDAFVAKYNADGTQAWIKQFGTSDYDLAYGISADSSGNIYVVGETGGTLPGNTNQGTGDAFVVKYNADGTQVWLKQFGTNYDDAANDVTVDVSGNIYVTGYTSRTLPGNTNQGGDDAFIAVFDSNGNLISPTITVQATDNQAAETLTGTTPNPGVFTLTRTGNPGQAITVNYTLTGKAIKGTDYTTVSNNVTFAAGSSTATVTINPIDDTIYEGTEAVTLTLSNGNNYFLGTAKTATVNIRDNDNAPPVNKVPTTQTINEDTTRIFSTANANVIRISDVDAGSKPVKVTLTTNNGILNLASTTGLTVTGNGTGSINATGTISAINTALNGLLFTPTANFNGNTSIQIVTNDQGYSGAGGAKTDTDTVAIRVNAVNDSPVNTVPSSQTINQNTSLVFSAANANAISISDIDAGSNPVKVTLTVNNGILNLASTTGLTFTGNGTGNLNVTGTISAINTALNGLTFTPSNNFNGAASLQIVTNDQGYFGAGGALTDTDTVAITVNAVSQTVTTTLNTDVINTGNGDDTVTANFEELLQNDQIKTGAGIDTLVLKAGIATSFISINLNNATNQLQNITGTTLLNLEKFDFSAFVGMTEFYGGAGNDFIKAGAGQDYLDGGSGDDSLNGGTGADNLIGGLGNDIYTVDNTGDQVLEGFNAGIDTIQSSVTRTLGNNQENLILLGIANINGTGNTLNNTITGNSGNNVINGGTGTDTMIGSLGNDTYTVDNINDVVTENANAGTDRVQSSVTWALGNNLENLTLTGSANINGTGNNLNNTIIGNGGSNILIGGLGSDILTGGVGNDFFRFNNSSEGIDTIKDFTVGNDVIQISASGFGGGLVVGTLSSFAFRSGAGITTANDSLQRFIYNNSNGALFFDADGNGASSSSVQIATLSGLPGLSANHIVTV